MSTMMQPVPRGWILAGTTRDIPESGIAPVDVQGIALMMVKSGDQISVYDAACPHRGSHLAYGGVLSRGCVICPFHGRRIRLVDGAGDQISVSRRKTIQLGEAIFVLSGELTDDRGLEQDVEAYQDWHFWQAVDMQIRVAGHWVVENAFDPEHFQEVHRVPGLCKPTLTYLQGGALQVSSEFMTVADPFAGTEIREGLREVLGQSMHVRRLAAHSTPFRAVAHSPFLVVTHMLEGNAPSVVITSGLRPLEAPQGQILSRVRVILGTPADTPLAVRERMQMGAMKAISEDKAVWEHIVPGHKDHLDQRDAPAIALSSFFQGFPGFESFALEI